MRMIDLILKCLTENCPQPIALTRWWRLNVYAAPEILATCTEASVIARLVLRTAMSLASVSGEKSGWGMMRLTM